MEKTDTPRILYLDAARCAAILLIALNHAVSRTWYIYTSSQEEFAKINRFSSILKTILYVFSLFGVPLFLMITGALILKRRFETKEELVRFYRHNWLSLLITAEIWFFIGYWFNLLLDPANQALREAGIGDALLGCLKTLLFVDQLRFGSMWYVPMILSVYVMLPLAAYLLHHLPDRRALLLPLIGVFLTDLLLPTINRYYVLPGNDPLHYYLYGENFLSAYLLYVFMGWWISAGGLKKLSDRALIAAAILCFLLCTSLQFFLFSCSAERIEYMSPGTLACSALLFECFRRYSERLRRWERPIAAISRSSFAVYLLHIYFMSALYWFCDFSDWPRRAIVMTYLLVSLAGSALIIWPLSKIPFCRKYLFLIE